MHTYNSTFNPYIIRFSGQMLLQIWRRKTVKSSSTFGDPKSERNVM